MLISVTLQPRLRKIDAYSQPMTPAPKIVTANGLDVVPQHAVAVLDARMAEIQLRRMIRPRAGGNDDVLAADARRVADLRAYLDRVLIDEPRRAAVDRHVIAVVETAAAGDLRFDHALGGRQQLRQLHVQVRADRLQQWVAARIAQRLHRMAQRLARDRAPVRAAAADLGVPLDDGDALAILRSHHGCAFAGGAAADDDDVERVHIDQVSADPQADLNALAGPARRADDGDDAKARMIEVVLFVETDLAQFAQRPARIASPRRRSSPRCRY